MVIGKPNYTTDEGETNISVAPEQLIVVDEPTRERWEAETAEFMLDRIEAYETALRPTTTRLPLTTTTTPPSFGNTLEPSWID